jgi:hypothetical protein
LKNSLNFLKLENYVHKVKELTEERERLALDFKVENDQLKTQIKSLEKELDNLQQEYHELFSKNTRTNLESNRLKSQDISDGKKTLKIL